MKKLVPLFMVFFLLAGNVFGSELITKRSKSKQHRKVVRTIKILPTPYEAYIVVDAETEIILEGYNITTQRPQASITKIMLAVVVMEMVSAGQLGLDEYVTVPKEAERIRGTTVNLKAREVFTVEDLMVAVLVESANDAAYTVAKHISGSVASFIVLMNEKARELGMTSTVYHSVNGLPPANGGEDNLTNCIDMVILAQEALRYKKIREWASIENAKFRKSIITNHNRLLGKFPEVDGIKTGFTRAAGFNIVATGKTEDRRIIVVILGSPTNKIRDAVAMDKFKEHLVKEGG